VVTAPLTIRPLVAALRPMRLDLAICAMPGALDLVMSSALARLAVPLAVIVHDADKHPGDGFPLQMLLQRRLVRRAAAVVVLSRHVGTRLTAQGLAGPHNLVTTTHPPFAFGPMPARPRAHGGKLRLLFFGRLLPYKGLDLLEAAMRRLGPRDDIELRVVGSGPASETLAALAALPGITVENRWVPEAEIGALIAWADALVLSYREASQSGVAAAAIGAGRWVVATRVGGMVEQLAQEPMAWLCDPDEVSLAESLRALTERASAEPPERDAILAWRHAASRLLSDVHTVIRQRAKPPPLDVAAKALEPIL
jgi:glycosyltransferase involved in cell wall biosynthesis